MPKEQHCSLSTGVQQHQPNSVFSSTQSPASKFRILRIAKSNVHYKNVEWYEKDLNRFSTTLKVAPVEKTAATSSSPRNTTTTDPDFDANVQEDGFILDESDQDLSAPKINLLSTTLIFIWTL